MQRPASAVAASAKPFLLKSLVKDLPLADGGKDDAQITCVEFWDGNLYVGTSAGELLHLVGLPAESPSESPTFILASRLEPTPASPTDDIPKGVQKILILPRSNKACILSNNVLTFHSLPELSPAAGNLKVSKCQWVGGLDLDSSPADAEPGEDIVMIGLASVIRILRIGDEPKGVSKMSFSGCLEGARRSRFACVADSHQYALLDVENQQKIPLFLISSTDQTPGSTEVETLVTTPLGQLSPRNSDAVNAFGSPSSHRRLPSLGDRLMAGLQPNQKRDDGATGDEEEENVAEGDSGTATPLSQPGTPRPKPEMHKPLPPQPQQEESRRASPQNKPQLLVPHILSPTSEEFLLTTGTGPDEPGVGMFVNLDGDVVRGTLEFARYPSSVVIGSKTTSGQSNNPVALSGAGSFVVAAFASRDGAVWQAGLEIQRWDELGSAKSWIPLAEWQDTDSTEENVNRLPRVGVFSAFSSQTVRLNEVSDRLRPGRLQMKTDDSSANAAEKMTTSDADDQFWQHMNARTSSVMCWSDTEVGILIETPLVVKLEAALDEILAAEAFQQDRLLQLVGRINNTEAASEAEFLTLAYMRQKIGLLAFEDILANRQNISPQISEKLFLESDMDPRAIISMVPLFEGDLDIGPSGISLSNGLLSLFKERLAGFSVSLDPDEVLSRPDDFDILGFIKRYLQTWRKRKGFGSIVDEAYVFSSVDAALLHLLLHQDARAGLFPGQISTLRVELYALIGGGLNCTDRVIELFEEYKRLYALSRLYGSQRASAKVLHIWRRIMEGEGDASKEFTNPDGEMRRYLGGLKDRSLIEEYGAYLARRNPSFGVQVFTDEASKVKLAPNQVVSLLEKQAPEAVKFYLEHLVFGKKNFEYANGLISYYLNSVLKVLDDETEEGPKKMLESSYKTYRALAAPKPTYRQFIAENGPRDLPWWNDRLRLLELLGGTFGHNFTYDVAMVQSRIRAYSQWLVPESIILDGRQGNHVTALRLLTHGLGDYHTAMNYCLLGGASIFHPAVAQEAGVDVPDRSEQHRLFAALFEEFLSLEDEQERQDQVGVLLGRFEGWFAVEDVLPRIPEAWPVEVVQGFLVGAIRRVVQEKAETMIVKALSGAENVIVSYEMAEKTRAAQPDVVHENVGLS